LPEKPLTFQDLRDKDISLALMVTDLSQQRPYLFPLRENAFLFRPDEMRRLFPERVVRALVDDRYRPRRLTVADDSPYQFLPPKPLQPVLVAARASLSFPLLFSAVPLYTLKPEFYRSHRDGVAVRVGDGDVQRHFLSDGGIVSNFPIHLFDEWLPRRPTFGINLSELPASAFEGGAAEDRSIKADYEVAAGEAPAAADAADADPAPPEATTDGPAPDAEDPGVRAAVFLPRANQPRPADWQPFDGLLGLLKAVFYTAKDHRDTMQSLLPSYRERIVTIRFASGEGGMNLTMAPATIETIMGKGRRAGQALRDEFRFEEHRWVRLLVVLGQLEEELLAIRDGIASDKDFETWLGDAAARSGLPYGRGQEWCDQSLDRLRKLAEVLGEHWQGPHFSDPRLPKPLVVKRLTPRD
jgi:hypothetical protein